MMLLLFFPLPLLLLPLRSRIAMAGGGQLRLRDADLLRDLLLPDDVQLLRDDELRVGVVQQILGSVWLLHLLLQQERLLLWL